MAQLSVTLAAALLAAVAASAQAQNAPRAVPLPDTLGADFPIADTATARGTASDFDFLLGTWQFTFQNRRADGTFNSPFTGHWSTHKKAATSHRGDGHDVQTVLVEDQWRPDDSTETGTSGVYTWRAFNSEQPRWIIQGINTWEARWEPGQAWSDGTNRYLVQHRGSVISRIRYFAITGNTFLWRADRSSDGGRTWQLDSGTMQAQRIGK